MQGEIYSTVHKDKVPAFLKLLDGVANKFGSMNKACKYVGISMPSIISVRNGTNNLSYDVARKILAAHKKLKESEHA